MRLPIFQLCPVLLLLSFLSLSGCATTIAGHDGDLIQYDAYSYKIVNSYPHNHAFTQGLIYHQGYLYETTGLKGQSQLLKVKLQSGKAIKTHDLPDSYFGEGMTLFQGKLYQVTYQAKTGFIYDLDSFKVLDTFQYDTEGWGLTHNNQQLIMSDGTDKLYFIDPKTMQTVRSVSVFDDNGAVKNLNELEYVDGLVLANVWYSENIVAIDPRSGKIVSTIDLSGLSPSDDVNHVYNGIAFDKDKGRLFVTGKRWSKLFEIQLLPKSNAKRLLSGAYGR